MSEKIQIISTPSPLTSNFSDELMSSFLDSMCVPEKYICCEEFAYGNKITYSKAYNNDIGRKFYSWEPVENYVNKINKMKKKIARSTAITWLEVNDECL